MSSIEKNEKTYWRSLNQLENTPEYRKFMEREFPENAAELNDPLTRRTFIKLMGASIAFAGLVGCRRPVEKVIPYVAQPAEVVPGIPNYYATTMPFGNNAYGLVVENHEGRPTKIEGNEKHPTTAGVADAWLQAQILELYDPDRSQNILNNGNPKLWSDFTAFWKEHYQKISENGGAGLAILSEASSSPTLARIKRQLQFRLPNAKWYTYEPISDENIYEGLRQAFGKPYHPVYHFDKAKIILSLDADFLRTESNHVVNARGFSMGRHVESEHDHMNRLYVAESTFTITGSAADHRYPLQANLIGAFLAEIAKELNKSGVMVAGLQEIAVDGDAHFERKWITAVTKDLVNHRGQCLVVVGRQQPPEVHALAAALNYALGNINQTVFYYTPQDAVLPKTGDLTELIQQMDNTHTLFILGGNPVYNAPADLNFKQVLSKIEHTIHLSYYLDETSKTVKWHIPRTHFLESWGDARTFDGTASMIQPLIAPLFEMTKSDNEVLNTIVTGEDVTGYDLTQQTWQEIFGEPDFEKKWQQALHDGLVKNSESIPVAVEVLPAELSYFFKDHPFSAKKANQNQLEIVFGASSAVFDGRFANNGWLQELPDPITKLTWDNVAIFSRKTARELGLHAEDMIELNYQGRKLVMPVWVLPGQPDHSVFVALGYGRKDVGRVANLAGFNIYQLRTSDHLNFGQGLTITKTGKTYPLANTQDHRGLDLEKLAAEAVDRRIPIIIREATLEEYHHHPDFVDHVVHELEHNESLWHDRPYDEGYQWGMAIDLNQCIGCGACVIACQSENNVPVVGKEETKKGREMHWMRIDHYFSGDENNPEMVHQAVPCQQCENAPCEQVCPVAATVHDEEGLNAMVYNRCIGTRYCSDNCPYKVRHFNFFNFTKHIPEMVKMAQNPDVTVRFRGVMEKCTYCLQRINYAKIIAKREGREIRDGEVLTACQQTCPAKAITFGNINDPKSKISQVKQQNRNYVLFGEFNFKPRTSYLAKLRNPNPELIASNQTTEAHSEIH